MASQDIAWTTTDFLSLSLLTYHQWHAVTFTLGWFHKIFSRYQSQSSLAFKTDHLQAQWWLSCGPVNILRPRQNGRLFADDIFTRIFLNENVWISVKISLKFVLNGSINNIPALVQITAWRWPGDKPLSEPMMGRLPTHICVTRPQWVNNAFLWHSTESNFTATDWAIIPFEFENYAFKISKGPMS